MRVVPRRALVVFVIAVAAVLPFAAASNETALDRYVHAADPSYRFELAGKIAGPGVTAFVLDLTSQTWTPPIAPNRAVWKHWLTVVRPDDVRYTTGFLFLTGGSNTDKAPDKLDPFLAEIAGTTHSVVAELRMVPNQPLDFPDAQKRDLVEDQFIAYTWDKFLRTGDERWPARLPMTKSAVRAMDAVQTFLKSDAGGSVSIANFVVSGASKRGWTTWTTAAVDKRVVAIAPLVIDVLNAEKSFEHHYAAYGFYSPAVKDYEDLGIMKWMGTPQFRKLMQIEEPYEYRDRLTIPKYIVNASGDQYFLPDSSRFYFDDLKGEKYLRYVPNTDHSLAKSDARENVIGFYDAFLRKQPRPRVAWKFESDGSIRVRTLTKPAVIKLWQATNATSRDFRVQSIGPAYRDTILSAESDGTYVGRVSAPAKGWTAFFVELRYEAGGKYPLTVTTAVRVTPETLAFEAPKPGKPAAPGR
jgi:PhoPQ-activated pathogenicity-related protein